MSQSFARDLRPAASLPLRLPAVIAVDLDDTLNDFTSTLGLAPFPYHVSYSLPEATFHSYLERVRRNAPEASDLQSTEFTFFSAKIHEQCYRLTRPRAEGLEFMRWLKEHGCRIVICTHRDLRRSEQTTRQWLSEHGVPFDHLFMARNKIVFCAAWGIKHLVDDDGFNIEHGAKYGVTVYYPIMDKHRSAPANGARGFRSFEEVKRWIQE